MQIEHYSKMHTDIATNACSSRVAQIEQAALKKLTA